MVLTCPSCAARLPAQLQGGGRVTCPRCAVRFTAVPPNRSHTPPLPGQPRVVEMSASEQTAERTLPPDAMAMIQLWEDASQDDEEETVEPDAPSLAAARSSIQSSQGVFLRRESAPAPAQQASPAGPPPVQATPPPIQARPYVPTVPARPSPLPPSERSASMNRPRIRPEPDAKLLAEQLVMDTMISARPVAPAAPVGPGLATWAALAALVLMCGGAGAVLANRLSAPASVALTAPVAPAAIATVLPTPAVQNVETPPDSEPPTERAIPVSAPEPARPAPVRAAPAASDRVAPRPPVDRAPAERPAPAPAPVAAPPEPAPQPAPEAMEVRTSDLKNPFAN